MERHQENEGKKASKENCRKIMCLVGAFLVFFPEHIVNFWGTMSVYITSYIFVKHGYTSAESPWALGAFSIGRNIGINIPGYVTCVGKGTVLFVSILVFNVVLVSLYPIVENGLTLTLFIVFGILGATTGVTDSIIFTILSEISSSSKGMYMSTACSAFNFGPLILNLFIGFYMNPYNTSPSLMVDGMALFGERDMLDKTLPMLIILATVSSVWMFAGFGLIALSTRPLKKQKCKDTGYGSVSREDRIQSVKSNQDNIIPTLKEQDNGVNVTKGDDSISSVVTLKHGSDVSEYNNKKKNNSNNNNDDSNSKSNPNHQSDLTPLQTVRCLHFHVFGLAFGGGLFAFILLSQYFKTFGLVYFADDHLLTDLGSGISLVQGISRIFWGLVLDRLSIKTIQIIICGHLSISCLIMYFSAAINKYLYFAVALFTGFGVTVVLPTYLLVCLRYFGEKHSSKNFGMLSLSEIIFGAIVPIAFDTASAYFGWFGIFCCTSIVTTLSLILTVIVVPDVRIQKVK